MFIQIVLDQGRLRMGREWWRFEKKLQYVAEIHPNNPNFPIIYLSNHFLIQSGMDRQGRFRQGKGVVGGLIEERAVDGRSPYCPRLSSKRTFGLLSPRWDVFFT